MKKEINNFTKILIFIYATLVLRIFLIGETFLGIYQIGFALGVELIILIVGKKVNHSKTIEKLRLYAWTLLLFHEISILGLYEIKGFDILMHAVWGIFLGFVFSKALDKYKLSKTKSILIIVVLIILIGLAWELTEFIWDELFVQSSQFGIAQPSLQDTIKDLIVNTIGAIVGFFISKRN